MTQISDIDKSYTDYLRKNAKITCYFCGNIVDNSKIRIKSHLLEAHPGIVGRDGSNLPKLVAEFGKSDEELALPGFVSLVLYTYSYSMPFLYFADSTHPGL